jgi:hypothetical protein
MLRWKPISPVATSLRLAHYFTIFLVLFNLSFQFHECLLPLCEFLLGRLRQCKVHSLTRLLAHSIAQIISARMPSGQRFPYCNCTDFPTLQVYHRAVLFLNTSALIFVRLMTSVVILIWLTMSVLILVRQMTTVTLLMTRMTALLDLMESSGNGMQDSACVRKMC